MLNIFKIILLSLVVFLAGCAAKTAKNLPTADGSTVSLEGFDKDETLAFFQSQQGQACFQAFSDYFEYAASQDNVSPLIEVGEYNEFHAIRDITAAALESMQNVSKEAIRGNTTVALAAQGFKPTYNQSDDMMYAMKTTCNGYGYYEYKRDQDVQQYAFWGNFTGHFFKTLRTLGLGYLVADVSKDALDKAATDYNVGGNYESVGGDKSIDNSVTELPEPELEIEPDIGLEPGPEI